MLGQREQHVARGNKARLWISTLIGMLIVFRIRNHLSSSLWNTRPILSDIDTQKPILSSNKSSATLEVFQVHQPVLMPKVEGQIPAGQEIPSTNAIMPAALIPHCELLIMNHSFANSYGHPFVGM